MTTDCDTCSNYVTLMHEAFPGLVGQIRPAMDEQNGTHVILISKSLKSHIEPFLEKHPKMRDIMVYVDTFYNEVEE